MQKRWLVALTVSSALVLTSSASAATITVTSELDESAAALDNGTCTLREAISAANATAAVDTCTAGQVGVLDTIVFQAALPSITLDEATSNEDANVNGDLDVLAGTGGLTIDGGAGQTINGNAASHDRVFHLISGSGLFKLDQVTVTGGITGSGSGVRIDSGQAEIEDSTITGNGNSAESTSGGGIRIDGTGSTLTIDNSEISSNTAGSTTGTGGGILANSPAALVITNGSVIQFNDATVGTSATGGGIQAGGSVTIDGSLIDGNFSRVRGGGISIAGNGSLTMTNSRVTNNDATVGFSNSGGGGISFGGTGNASIDDSQITGNTAGVTGSTEAIGGGIAHAQFTGALEITDTLIEDNDATRSGAGIDLTSGSGALALRRSVVAANDIVGFPGQAQTFGAGINDQTNAALTIEDSLISDNTSAGVPGAPNIGAGLRLTNSNPTIKRTTIEGNSLIGGDQAGAGINIFGGGNPTLTFTNVTVAGNSAPGAAATGGGIHIPLEATVDLTNATFSGNSASSGPGIFKAAGFGVVTLRSTIVDDGCNATLPDSPVGSSFQSPAATSCGLSLGSPGFTGVLQNNGGPPIGPASDPRPRQTLAVGFAGSAIDRVAGDCLDHTGAAVTEDAREIPRFFDAETFGPPGCDSGAIELVKCVGEIVDGPDAITGTTADEALNGSGSADQIYGASGDDIISGGGGNDTICGVEGNDQLVGDGGNDRLSGGLGNDTINGGASGVTGDTGDYFESATPVNANLSAGSATGEGSDTLTDLENLQGSGEDDVLVGNSQANSIVGPRSISTGVDDDVLSGGAGAGPDESDILVGGTDPGSVDTVTYAGRNDNVTANLSGASGGDTVGPETDSLQSFENAIGGNGADAITGTTGPNQLTGGAGVDTISADTGADSLFIRDGGQDSADCGTDNPGDIDTVQADQQGVDLLAPNCAAPDVFDFFVSPPAQSGTTAAGNEAECAALRKKLKKAKTKKKKKKIRKQLKKLGC